MRIVGIVGMLDFPKSDDRVWKRLREEFESQFPSVHFSVEHQLYLPWQKEKMRRFWEAIARRYENGEDVILIGYSLGGILACAVASRLVKTKVRMVVTIGTPHRPSFFYRYLGITDNKVPGNIPILSFGALLDPVVPYLATKHPEAAGHYLLLGDHLLSFLFSNRPAYLIASTTRKMLAERSNSF